MITGRYVLRRSLYALATSFVAIVLNFLLPRIIPGNPAAIILFANYHYLPPGKVQLLEPALQPIILPKYTPSTDEISVEVPSRNSVHGRWVAIR